MKCKHLALYISPVGEEPVGWSKIQEWELRNWHSSQEHLLSLLLQRICVQFPGLTLGGSQLPVPSAPGNLTPPSGLRGHMHTPVHIQASRHTHTVINKNIKQQHKAVRIYLTSLPTQSLDNAVRVEIRATVRGRYIPVSPLPYPVLDGFLS